MAAAAPNNPDLDSNATNEQFLSAITYNSVASVIKQCDKSNSENVVVNANAGGFNRVNYQQHSSSNFNGNRNSREDVEARKMKYPCNNCGKYGHWAREHNKDGTLPSNVKSVDKLEGHNSDYQTKNNQNNKKTISFNMARLAGSSAPTTISNYRNQIGPLVDDGAPYSAIGLIDLKFLANQLDITLPITLNAIPTCLKGHTH